jgi:hypothetical protein
MTGFYAKPTPAALEELVDLHMERAIICLPQGTSDELLPVLDRYARQLGQWLPTPGLPSAR